MDRAVRFYSDLLGLTLVKKTVNPDDPYTPLLVFGDRRGTAGTQIHVLIYPKSARALPGIGTAASVALRVPKGSLPFWEDRLGKSSGELVEGEDSRLSLAFEGLEGLQFYLVEEEAVAWWSYDQGSDVGEDSAVRGLHSVSVTVDSGGQRFWIDRGWSSVRPAVGSEDGSLGHGGVHHLAFSGELSGHSLNRHYYRSSYFYDPNGLLCEVVAEGPGLTFDEPEDQLGERWCLPTCYQNRRVEIERVIRSMK
jgi:glyoxalase family protein